MSRYTEDETERLIERLRDDGLLTAHLRCHELVEETIRHMRKLEAELAEADEWKSAHATLLKEVKALQNELAEARKQAVGLWKLLDDIDTASDMFKDNYEALAGYVYRNQRERFDIVSGEQFDAMCDALEVWGD